MNNKLKVIASLVEMEDKVIDMACDHAYLALYLKENNLCEKIIASDISEGALKNARENIQKRKAVIKTYLSDGFKEIDDTDINTVIIAGVGTLTIKHILEDIPKNINKFIISSNNSLEELRIFMQKKGFYNKEELAILENGKYYVIIKFIKSNLKDDKFILKYGKSQNKNYYNYLITKNKEILKNIPLTKIITRLNIKKENRGLKRKLKERTVVD